MNEKIYMPLQCKEVKFNDGGSLINISGRADAVIEFVTKHKNDRGYINLVLAKRRENGKYGETHNVTLSTYEPKQQATKGDSAP
jgi:hypothetical protein